MLFKYFEQPELFSSFIDEIVACDLCNNKTRCFNAATFTGTDELRAICPQCLAAGELYKMDISTCSADIIELKRQLKMLNAHLNDVDIDKMAAEKTNELEKTTPPLITWQDWDWPCADADYCIFIGFGSLPLYEKLAADKDPMELFIESFYYNLKDTDAAALWEESLPDNEIKNSEDSNQYSRLFYVFKSLHHNTIVTIWDCD